jgi:Mnd1 HTH domain
MQILADDGKVRVEKIGSGNWYWSFASDAKKSKEKLSNDLKAEQTRLNGSVKDIVSLIEEEMAAREDDEMLDACGMDRKALLETHEALLKEATALEGELASYSGNDPMEVVRKADETRKLKEIAEKWTDVLEGVEWLLMDITQDRARVAEIMANICGEEYVIGEGLKEL